MCLVGLFNFKGGTLHQTRKAFESIIPPVASKHCNIVRTHIKQGLSLELIEAGVDEAQHRQALQQPLVIDERQDSTNHWG